MIISRCGIYTFFCVYGVRFRMKRTATDKRGPWRRLILDQGWFGGGGKRLPPPSALHQINTPCIHVVCGREFTVNIWYCPIKLKNIITIKIILTLSQKKNLRFTLGIDFFYKIYSGCSCWSFFFVQNSINTERCFDIFLHPSFTILSDKLL